MYKLMKSTPPSIAILRMSTYIILGTIVPTAKPGIVTDRIDILKSTNRQPAHNESLTSNEVDRRYHQQWLTYILMGQHQGQLALADHGELSGEAFTAAPRAAVLCPRAGRLLH